MHPMLTWTLLAVLAAAFAFGFWLDGRPDTHKLGKYRRWSLVLQFGALAAAVAMLRPGAGTHRTADEFVGAIGRGTPVLIDVYSNW